MEHFSETGRMEAKDEMLKALERTFSELGGNPKILTQSETLPEAESQIHDLHGELLRIAKAYFETKDSWS